MFLLKKITILSEATSNSPSLILQTTENELIKFSEVSTEIYNFEIGSYRPIDKWLKYRINDKVLLKIADISHIKNMIISIKNTIEIMEKIKNLSQNYLNDL